MIFRRSVLFGVLFGVKSFSYSQNANGDDQDDDSGENPQDLNTGDAGIIFACCALLATAYVTIKMTKNKNKY